MNAPLSMVDVIRRAATHDKACPFCGEYPPLASKIAGRFIVGCDSEECDVHPQTAGATVEEAWQRWNRRPS